MRRRSFATAESATSSRAASSWRVRSSSRRPTCARVRTVCPASHGAAMSRVVKTTSPKPGCPKFAVTIWTHDVLRHHADDGAAAIVAGAHQPAGEDRTEDRHRDDTQALADEERSGRHDGRTGERRGERIAVTAKERQRRGEGEGQQGGLRFRQRRERDLDHRRNRDGNDDGVTGAASERCPGAHGRTVPRAASCRIERRWDPYQTCD